MNPAKPKAHRQSIRTTSCLDQNLVCSETTSARRLHHVITRENGIRFALRHQLASFSMHLASTDKLRLRKASVHPLEMTERETREEAAVLHRANE